MKYAIIVVMALLTGCTDRPLQCPDWRVTEVLDMRECVKEKVCHISAQEYADAAAVIRACPEKFQ